MIISGKIKEDSPSTPDKHLAITQLIVRLEKAKYEVRRRGNRIEVSNPGLDTVIFPFTNSPPWASLFWDRYVLEAHEDGGFSYRLRYWTASQIALHAILTAMLAFDFALGGSGWSLERFFLFALFANAVPLLLAIFGVRRLVRLTQPPVSTHTS